jgi:hypothetical protein
MRIAFLSSSHLRPSQLPSLPLWTLYSRLLCSNTQDRRPESSLSFLLFVIFICPCPRALFSFLCPAAQPALRRERRCANLSRPATVRSLSGQAVTRTFFLSLPLRPFIHYPSWTDSPLHHGLGSAATEDGRLHHHRDSLVTRVSLPTTCHQLHNARLQ